MLRTISAFILALLPLDSMSAFYLRIPYDFFRGGTAYGMALLCLFGAIIFSFLCPVPLGIWWIGWRNRVAKYCLVLSLLAALVSLTVLYFDPGHAIARFMAD